MIIEYNATAIYKTRAHFKHLPLNLTIIQRKLREGKPLLGNNFSTSD